ncbi:MAG: hypothetical protein IMX00_06325 [Limnochordales bacterium]|nr:hypothetical protein [Limnochordales bacterium]
MDVTQKTLLIRQVLSTQNPAVTPVLHDLTVSITPASVSLNDPTPSWEMVWYEYDALNRPVRVYTNRLATELWDITSYEYDLPLDQPTRVDLPGETEPVHIYEYNSRGLKTKEDMGRPEEIRWTYDAAGRVKRIEYPNGTSVNYTYSGNGESYVTIAELLENGTLWKVETRKNLRGWVTLEAWEIDGVSYKISYTYDDAGNRTSMTYPDGTTVSFEYNERNQLVRIPGFFEGPVAGAWTDNAGFRYDANGFLIGMRAVNGIETTFQPDERNRLKQISSPPLTLTYAYTPGGNVASITDASSGEPFTLTYGYDGANRLISAQVRMPTGIETVQYVYDALGNRIKEAWTDARGAIDYSYLPGNYLVQRGSTSYSWGTYGQLILKDDQPNALGGETNYDYNVRRLMTQVRVDGSPVAQFFYDPYGRRVKIVEGDTTTITLYSGNDIVYEVKTKPGQPTVTTKYLAINGKYLAKVVQEGTNPPQTYFYHTDLVGSVRAITDSQGQVVARFEYEPFGVTVQASGPLAGSEVHKFTGKPEDVAIDLYYFNARYYDPAAGRFLSSDPARQGLNYYVYVSNRPLSSTDPTGLWEPNGNGGWVSEPGDTLWDLAVIVYGDGTRWKELGYQGDPTKLPVGYVITPKTTQPIVSATGTIAAGNKSAASNGPASGLLDTIAAEFDRQWDIGVVSGLGTANQSVTLLKHQMTVLGIDEATDFLKVEQFLEVAPLGISDGKLQLPHVAAGVGAYVVDAELSFRLPFSRLRLTVNPMLGWGGELQLGYNPNSKRLVGFGLAMGVGLGIFVGWD